MSTRRLIYLIEKFKAGTIREEERDELLALLSENGRNSEVEAFLADLWHDTTADTPVFEPAQSAGLLKNILGGELDVRQPAVRKLSPIWRWSTIAAAATIILLCGYFLLGQKEIQSPPQIAKQSIQKPDVAPGGNRATLVLADNTRIFLDSAGTGTLTKMGGVSVKKTANGQISYVFSGSVNANEAPVYNTIITPRGGEYSVVLPDGSKVWLNASSSLRFPSFFNGNDRRVELSGEGYFEVAKHDGKRFYVTAGNSEVEVLGTHFNINAYADENENSTTLLEGSVRISSNGVQRTIVPGQQAVSVKGKEGIEVSIADIERVTAWKNGSFIFADENIHSIMRKLARWYNIDVEYQNPSINETFAGTVSRSKNISEVLDVLETTGTIHFKIIPGNSAGAGRRVLVMN